ncbi:MAG: hypothetical protein M0R38_08220 [Bacteroidia bacterium]|nr:hypothetical protein [Bacteroidia bacterium]
MHFFTEHTILPAQEVSDKYGPDGGTSSDLYNISARFELPKGNTAKAFACQAGLMLVQQSSVDSDLVNVLIKPNESPKSYLQVKYYIYRGILKSSLISGNDITPADISNNELIARFWDENENHPDPKAYLIGFDNSLPDSTDIEDILLCTVSGTVEPIYVKEGEWFGDFGGTHETEKHPIDFEVLIDNAEEVITTLGYLRNGFYNSDTSKYQVNVTSKSNLEKRRIREQILSFIDPAALFGMFYNEKVGFTEYPSGSKVAKDTNNDHNTPEYIYTVFLNKFETKHTVYLDIRSDRGFSYNFYGNYDDQTINNNNIKIKLGSAAVTPQKYQTNDWPIIIISQSQNWTGTNPIPAKNRIKFQLRLDDVGTSGSAGYPLIFLENISVLNPTNNNKITSNWIAKKALLEGNIPNVVAEKYTKEVTFHFPHKDSGSTKNNVAHYIQICYFRQNHSLTPSSTVMPSSKYFNNAFVELDRLVLGTYKDPYSPGTPENPVRKNKTIESGKYHLIHQKLNENDGTGNFAFCAKSGAYWERTGAPMFGGEYPARVLLYTTIYKEDENNSNKKFLPTYNRRFNLHENSLFENSKLRNDMDLICRSYKIDNNDIKMLGINWYSESGREDVSKNHKENLMLLGLTHKELTAIYETTGLAYDDFHRYIYLDPDSSNPLTSDAPENIRYHKYTIRIQGIANTTNGNGINEIGMITPQLDEQDIVVYSRDNQFFHSQDFSEPESLSPGQNRLEMHIYELPKWQRTVATTKQNPPPRNGMILCRDNIDLSLVYDVQNVYFIYFRKDGSSAEVCNSELVLCHSLNNGKVVSTEYLNAKKWIPDPGYEQPHFHVWTYGVDKYRPREIDLCDSYTYLGKNRRVLSFGMYRGSEYRVVRYFADEKMGFMVHLEALNLQNPNIKFEWVKTIRYYCQILPCAAFLGVLAQVDFGQVSAGMAYPDASCFPSTTHTNGKAVDTRYGIYQSRGWAEDQIYLDKMYRYGFDAIYKGDIALTLKWPATYAKYHEDHLHCGGFIMQNNKIRIDE